MNKRGKIGKEKIILIIGIILIIISIAINIPIYVRESYCEKKGLKGELPLKIYIGPPGMACPQSGQTGDINGDGCVDMADLKALTDYWLTGCSGEPPCGSDDCDCIFSDLSDDGCVNADDFAILADNWGECTVSKGS